MLGADEIPTLDSPPPRHRRYFSPWFTLLCTLLAIGLIVVYAAPWRGSPLDSLDRPAEALERLVSRDLDLRDALRGTSSWEQWLYGLLSGDEDSIEEALRWYEELLDTVGSAAAELDYAVLKAEVGEPLPRGPEDEADWVALAYSPDPVDPEDARAVIARVRAEFPANWFTDRLVQRLAAKIGDAATAAQATEDTVARGRSLLMRWRALTALEGALILGALLLLLRARRRGLPALGTAPMPPTWGLSDGYALVVRGMLGLLGLTLMVIVLVPDARTLIQFVSFLAGVPVLVWTIGYLRAKGDSFSYTFGFDLPPRAIGSVLALALILVGVGGAAESGIGSIVGALGIESHWADGLPEDLLWDPPWRIVVGVLDTVVWTPFVEELTFRGLLYGTLRTRTGAPLAALASGCLFAAAHGYGLAGFASVFMSGILWALAYEKSRSLLPGIVAHAVNNLSVTVTYLVLLRL
ncbi:MAG TPA: type II CAAX endopeptidase family protein [Methylomirabilota bacterium]|nr:type II CAAX endopeptidase family protein [Methylomirabilota bacterium]